MQYCQMALLTLRAARSECWELRASALPQGYLRTGQNLQAGGQRQRLNISGAQQAAASSHSAAAKALPANQKISLGRGPDQQDGKPRKASRAAAATILLYWALPPQQDHTC